MKKIFARLSIFVLILAAIIFIVIVAKNGYTLKTGLDEDGRFTVAMVTDGGGINDQSFQQSAWEGMQEFAKRTGSRAAYLESHQTSELQTNMDRFADEKADLIWGMGFKLDNAIKWAASVNPELNYAIADFSYGEDTPDNVTCAVFHDEESSFLVGYIAGLTTKTNAVGFLGGEEGNIVIDRFDYGYRAGVAYAAKELGKEIKVQVQYAASFSDVAKGKAIAQKMFSECDVVFHAAGGAGVGMIEAAKELGRYAIGVDLDQSHLAPANVLTSALKNTGKAVDIISTKILEGEKIGGQTFKYGLKENAVGIPENNPNMDHRVYKKAMLLKQRIINEEIVAPDNLAVYEKFMKELPNLKIL